MEDGGWVTLQEAADLLGVHYMTAYRYVRLGTLPAEKVGSTWQVALADVEALRAGPPRAGGRRQKAPWAERLQSRLLAGDERGAWGVVEGALTAGSAPADVYLDILAPALRAIGDLWACGDIDVADEHRASVVAQRIVGRLSPRFNRRGRTRGCVVLGCAPGERHALPTAMLADVLRQVGWAVVDLGGDVPEASFLHAVRREGSLVAVGVSASWDGSLEPARAMVSRLRGEVDVPVLAGGAAVQAAADDLGAHGVAADGREAIDLLERLRRA
jgi:excisionase family DNA binding protein